MTTNVDDTNVKSIISADNSGIACGSAIVAACSRMVIVFPLTHAVTSSAGLGDEVAFAEMADSDPEALKVGLVLWFLEQFRACAS
jgi:hypothetical protein